MGLYFDYLPVLMSQRVDILRGGEYIVPTHLWESLNLGSDKKGTHPAFTMNYQIGTMSRHPQAPHARHPEFWCHKICSGHSPDYRWV